MNALPNGFPATDDGRELKLLAKIFTPEEAELAALLTPGALLRFEKLWAAAGAPNALFAIETQILVTLTQGRIAEIVV